MPDESGIDSEMPSDFDYDTIPVGYYDNVYRRRRGIQSKWHHMKFNLAKQMIPPGRHLDLACGTGTFLGTISELGSQQIGVDISFPQVKEAKIRYGQTGRSFLQSDTNTLPFRDDTFDAVSAVELIEHLVTDSIQRAFAESFRVLKPGGTFFLTTPNYRSLIWLIEPMIGWFSEVSYSDQHITKFNRKSLRKTLQNNGFENVLVNGFMFSAPFLAFLGWNIPDKMAKLEPKMLTNHLGLLLYASATKPET